MLDRDPLPFANVNDRLKLRWNRLLAVLAERSESFWLDLAETAFHQQQYEDALVNAYQALAINPNDARALTLQGMILQAKAYLAETIEQHEVLLSAMVTAYQRVIQADPAERDNIERRLKHIYYHEFKQGVEDFQRGLYDQAAFSRAAIYFKLAALIRSVVTSAFAAPDTPWGASVNQALASYNAGQPEEACAALETAVKRGDTSLNTFLLLAELYAYHRRHEQAVRMLEYARGLLPAQADQLEAHFLNACLRAGRVDEALSIYEVAVDREPDNPHLHYNYGTLLIDQGAFDAAIEHLAAAIRLSPDDGDALYNLGVAYINKACSHSAAGYAPGNHQQALFKQALIPLEKARLRAEAHGEAAGHIYQALFKAYSHTDQEDKADALLPLINGQ